MKKTLKLDCFLAKVCVSRHIKCISPFRIERNLFLLCAHTANSEWLSIISDIIFEVNVVAEQKQEYW